MGSRKFCRSICAEQLDASRCAARLRIRGSEAHCCTSLDKLGEKAPDTKGIANLDDYGYGEYDEDKTADGEP